MRVSTRLVFSIFTFIILSSLFTPILPVYSQTPSSSQISTPSLESLANSLITQTTPTSSQQTQSHSQIQSTQTQSNSTSSLSIWTPSKIIRNDSVVGTLILPTPSSETNSVVLLSTDDKSVIDIPQTVTIEQYKNQGYFNIKGLKEGTANIYASYNGDLSQTSVTVFSANNLATSLKIILPANVTKAEKIPVYIFSIDQYGEPAAVKSDTTIVLSASSHLISLPPNLLITNGTYYTSFVASVDGSGDISASANGLNFDQVHIDKVQNNVSVGFAVAPDIALENSQARFYIWLEKDGKIYDIPSLVDADLSSNNPDVAKFGSPSQIAHFSDVLYHTQLKDGMVKGTLFTVSPGSTTITVDVHGYGSATANLVVGPAIKSGNTILPFTGDRSKLCSVNGFGSNTGTQCSADTVMAWIYPNVTNSNAFGVAALYKAKPPDFTLLQSIVNSAVTDSGDLSTTATTISTDQTTAQQSLSTLQTDLSAFVAQGSSGNPSQLITDVQNAANGLSVFSGSISSMQLSLGPTQNHLNTIVDAINTAQAAGTDLSTVSGAEASAKSDLATLQSSISGTVIALSAVASSSTTVTTQIGSESSSPSAVQATVNNFITQAQSAISGSQTTQSEVGTLASAISNINTKLGTTMQVSTPIIPIPADGRTLTISDSSPGLDHVSAFVMTQGRLSDTQQGIGEIQAVEFPIVGSSAGKYTLSISGAGVASAQATTSVQPSYSSSYVLGVKPLLSLPGKFQPLALVYVSDSSGAIVDPQSVLSGTGSNIDVSSSEVSDASSSLIIQDVSAIPFYGTMTSMGSITVSAASLLPTTTVLTPLGIATSVDVELPQVVHVGEQAPLVAYEIDSFGKPVKRINLSGFSATQGVSITTNSGNQFVVLDRDGQSNIAAISEFGAVKQSISGFYNHMSVQAISSNDTSQAIVGKGILVKLYSDLQDFSVLVDSILPIKKLDLFDYLVTPNTEGKFNVNFVTSHDGYQPVTTTVSIDARKVITVNVNADGTDGKQLHINPVIVVGNTSDSGITPYSFQTRPSQLVFNIPKSFDSIGKHYVFSTAEVGPPTGLQTFDNNSATTFLSGDSDIDLHFIRMINVDVSDAVGSGSYPYGSSVVLDAPDKQKISFLVREVFDHWVGLPYTTKHVVLNATQDVQGTAVYHNDYTYLMLIMAAGTILGLLAIYRKRGMSLRWLLQQSQEKISEGAGALKAHNVESSEITTKLGSKMGKLGPLIKLGKMLSSSSKSKADADKKDGSKNTET